MEKKNKVHIRWELNDSIYKAALAAVAYLGGGPLGHGPPFGKKYVFLTYKKVGKLGNYPPSKSQNPRRLPPLEVTEPRRLPPPRSHRTSPTTPPSKSQNLADYPPPLEVTLPPLSKSQKLADYPPLEKFWPPPYWISKYATAWLHIL